MIQPKIVVRNTSGRRPPAPGRREKPGRRQAPPLPTTGYHLARVSLGGYATFYVSTQSFDDRDKPPAVSRGVSLPPPWGWVPPPPCGVPWGQGVAYSEN